MIADIDRPRGAEMRFFAAIFIGLVLLICAGLVAQRMSDGPMGPLPGGKLRSGPLVTERDVDWSAATDGKIDVQTGSSLEVELQLVNPPSSRTTGVMLHEGELYIPCDLGYIWNRFSGNTRYILNAIYLVKRWHHDAERDGRVVIRLNGKRYERQAVRVKDPEMISALKAQINETLALMDLPEELGPIPTEEPNDIWFFRIDPRPAG